MPIDEEQILIGVNQKDEKVWSDFYDRYYPALCSYVAKLLRTSDGVEDLVQEVFIALWEGNKVFSDIKELTAYTYRACYNNTLIYIRNHHLHATILNTIAKDAQEWDEEALYAITVREEVIRQLYCHIEQLPTEQRKIMFLRMEGHSWEQIAVILGISINTVKTQKSRSYKFLRSRLDDSTYLIPLFLLYL